MTKLNQRRRELLGCALGGLGAAASAQFALPAAFAKTDLSAAADDRILVFFAGHGHTVTGRHQETGFLVPVDGNIE